MTAPLEHTTQLHLSSSQQHRLQATSNLNKRREYLLSRALMRHAFDEYIKPQQQVWQFVEQPNSPPIVSNLPQGLHISLTHSKGIICFALASCPIGIDLERIREDRDFIGLAETAMNEQEIEFLRQTPEELTENFYRIWCAKEAQYKALSSQQQSSTTLRDITVMPWIENENHEGSDLVTMRNSDYMLAIAAQEKFQHTRYKHFPESDVGTANFAQGFGAISAV